MFDVNVVSADRVRHYSVVLSVATGWDVKFEENRTLRWHEHYEDWHRVERTLARVKREVSELLDHGWRLEPAH